MAGIFKAMAKLVGGGEPDIDDDDGRLTEWTNDEIEKMKRSELKVELAKRNLEVKGNKKTLRARLKLAVREEKEQKLAYEAMVESKRKAEADLEASGSVYVVGLGSSGQLGMDSNRDHRRFRCIMSIRGKGIKNVYASPDAVMCLCDSGDVWTFGGGGIGPLCQEVDKTLRISDRRTQDTFLKPSPVERLKGEGVVGMAISSGHGAAVSDGGDAFTWGSGRFGQLGLGEPLVGHELHQLVDLPVGEYAKQVSVGPCHTVCACESGKVYVWGLASNGQLGVGTRERHGVRPEQKSYFPVPTLVKALELMKVTQVASGSNHVVVTTLKDGTFSWGSGDGGRLGTGDMKDRLEPARIEALSSQIVLQVAAGIWHSAAVVALPPIRAGGGLLYTWGSGYHGQLAQGTKQVCLTPEPVLVLRDMHVFASHVECGSHHCALISMEQEVYTWGNNKHCELGRGCKEQCTPVPGKVSCFGVIVGRVPRGKVTSIACGRGFTVMATDAYNGPSEGEIERMQEEETELIEEREAEALRLKEAEFAHDERLAATLAPKMRIGFLCQKCECDMDKCPGFEGHLLHPHICKWCGHTARVHDAPNPKMAGHGGKKNKTAVPRKSETQITDDDLYLPMD